MDSRNFAQYIGKQVYIGTIDGVGTSATLIETNEYGVILSTNGAGASGHATERFAARFYPWVAIRYLDLDVTGTEARKSA